MVYESFSDAELAHMALRTERLAFDELIKRHQRPLYRFVRRYLGNDADAQDLVQDTFISAWIALKRYDGSRSFSTWLRAIALNKCRDLGRRQAVRRRVRALLAFLEPSAQVTAPDTTNEQQGQNERLRRLDIAIAELPAFYKEPLLLTSVSGLSHKETAEQLDTTVKGIEMRVRRARQKLADALSDLKGEG